VSGDAAEALDVLGHTAQVGLKGGKPFLERSELLKKLFLGETLLGGTEFVFPTGVEKAFHDGAPFLFGSLRTYTAPN
jgi:hypothetical protein